MKRAPGRLRCRYRRCQRFVPASRGRGPRREFCDKRCRRLEREERDRESGRGYQPHGYPASRPERRALKPGDRFGSLLLVGYVDRNPSGSSRALFACDCGQRRELTVNNVRRGVTTTCGDRSAHTSEPNP